MVTSRDLDPTHTSCIRGQTVVTCRSCAGNAPRSPAALCSGCDGVGFEMFVCTHCHPATVGTHRASSSGSGPSTPGSLSRSSSTSVSSYNSGSGRVQNNPPRRS
ncbi:hypothetical protein BDW62DRAFT_185444 [Aspergillus aurantiobrunneus]